MHNVGTHRQQMILGWLSRLDRMLYAAIAAAGEPPSGDDPFRGLHVSHQDVVRLMAQDASAVHPAAEDSTPAEPPPTGELLADRYGLTGFDLDLLLVGLAPEVDLRYQRIYAYLQDDITRRWATVDLALSLLCRTPEEKLARRVHFAADRPLLRAGLVRLVPEPGQLHTPLLAHQVAVDPQLVDALLGGAGVDSRLASWCEVTVPEHGLDRLTWVDAEVREVAAAALGAASGGEPGRLYLAGERGSGRRAIAEAVAAEAGRPLLRADLVAAPPGLEAFTDVLAVLFREAFLFGAVLHLHDVDALAGDPRRDRLLAQVGAASGLVVRSGSMPWIPGPAGSVLAVSLSTPDRAGRVACWQAGLAARGCELPPEALVALAGRFRLNPGQIDGAAADACLRTGGAATVADLSRAARRQTGHRLARLARKVVPRAGWRDLVLPADSLDQLRELCQRAAARPRVLDDWGFGRKLSGGTGSTALFLGPSGTGKSLAAEVVAGELGLDMYKIDLAGVVSKYIGETEKNLERIFTAAGDANGVLFFDEAEALFGKRSEVRDSHDRYANIEIAYLLQKMEEYEGIAILATNLKHTLDEAFVRRLAFSVHFPFPDPASRRRIWSVIWPAEIPLASDLDLDTVAQRFTLSGGNIKNVALAAAFRAAADGGVLTNAHLLHSVRREFQKLGRTLSEADLQPEHSP